ncbi:MAG: glycoside hydrolase family 88 protein [Bacteroidales bacterium]|nr:glycoside hydrolase family 88 protein [Bacteroidales bacterium]
MSRRFVRSLATGLTLFLLALPSVAATPLQEHPRLILSEAEMASIQAQIAQGDNEALCLLHGAILKKADELLSAKPLTYKKDASGKRILGVSRNAAQRIGYCAYAWRFSGDRRYLDKALETLRTVCDFKDWNPNHYLDVCEMASGVGIGYDWLYKELGPELRSTIEDRLKRYAFDTIEKTPADPATPAYRHEDIWVQKNNRNQVNLAGLTCAALAVEEVFPEIAETLIPRVVASNLPVVEYIYNPDGAYPEGPGYWNYGTGYQVWLNTLLSERYGNTFGLDAVPGFRKTPYFEVFASGSSGQQFNFCDCRPEVSPRYALWYFASLLDDPTLLYTELRYMRENDYTASQQRALIFIPLKYAARIRPADIKPSPLRVFAADGVNPLVLACTGWHESDLWLGAKGGKANSSHAHMDAGEFVFDAYGVRWSKDVYFYPYDQVEKPLKQLGGNYWSYAQESMRWQVSRVNCRWHSTLIFDEEDHLVDGFVRKIADFDTPERKGASFDLTPLYDGPVSVTRTPVIRDNAYLEVTDCIKTGRRAHTVRFNLVSEGEPELLSDGILLRKDGVTMKLQTSGAQVNYRIWPSDPSDFSNFPFEETAPDTWICGFTVKLPKKSETTLLTTLRRVEDPSADYSPRRIGNRIIRQFLSADPMAYAPKGFDGPYKVGKGNSVHYAVASLWANALAFARRTEDGMLEKKLTDKFEPFFGTLASRLNRDDHVDFSIFGIVPLEIYLLGGDKRAYALGMHYADHQWETPTGNPDPSDGTAPGNLPEEQQLELLSQGYSPQTRFWIDDMYMISALQRQAYRVTGDKAYIERAAREMLLYMQKLQRENGLFYHAPDVPFYWGRGDGWMAAGLPLLLSSLPEDDPCFAPLLESYRKMMSTLLKFQRPDGLWGQLLDDPEVWPETSCSAMFAYAFIEGVKHGWLEDARYGAAARKAWRTLCARLDAYGNLSDICVGTSRKNSREWYLGRTRVNGDPHGQAAMLWICNAALEGFAL